MNRLAERIPLDSADAAELRDIEAAAGEAVPVGAPLHDRRCRSGWLGEDLDGRPLPCLICRPHLSRRACHGCGGAAQVCAAQLERSGTRCCVECHHFKSNEAAS